MRWFFPRRFKYLYVGRDGRDIAWSLYNHYLKGNGFWYDALNETPGLVGPKFPRMEEGTDALAYFTTWFEKDGYPFWPFWENIRTWWAIRELHRWTRRTLNNYDNLFAVNLSVIRISTMPDLIAASIA